MIDADGAYERGFAITPDNTAPLKFTTRAIWVGTTGNITLRLYGDSADVTLNSVPVGLLRVRATHVRATGTAASNLVGLG